eukprot:7184436-Pyramimonas_sp.AAC.1
MAPLAGQPGLYEANYTLTEAGPMAVEIGIRGDAVPTPSGGVTVAGLLAAARTRVLGSGLAAAAADVREELF